MDKDPLQDAAQAIAKARQDLLQGEGWGAGSDSFCAEETETILQKEIDKTRHSESCFEVLIR